MESDPSNEYLSSLVNNEKGKGLLLDVEIEDAIKSESIK